MTPTIHVSVERPRGCGYRKVGPGGLSLYLVGSPTGEVCERLPFPLTTCPGCGGGIKFSRGLQHIDAATLFAADAAPTCCASPMAAFLGLPGREHHHDLCTMCAPETAPDAWLMWVGREFYSPTSFHREAMRLGVSKRISALPRGFTPGESVVYLAHLDAVPPWHRAHPDFDRMTGRAPEAKPAAGVIMVFRPALDIVVDTTDTDQLPPYARELAERFPDTARLVKVERAEDVQPAMLPVEVAA
jgi:hypothetical protein